MKATPVKGTNDYLPKEVRIRDYLQEVILKTYQEGGFERITTPILEDMENLDKSDGGENLGLIFKILKRGDKLTKALDQNQYDQLSDIGLRYDLTLPLSRYYANNRAKLVLPFKCIQMDRVYRAERPQKGRLREFMQCDIDIVGTSSPDAEVELIHTTTKALMALGLKDFTVKINDRRILRGILSGAGFQEDEQDSVCIVFDKLDKIGAEGVAKELLEKGFDKEPVDNLIKLLDKEEITLDTVETLCGDNPGIANLRYIMDAVEKISSGAYQVVYEMSLVRGQGYYTGTVFEVEAKGFRGAIAGGGRYDNLIGKFTKEDIPAVGFSIGFERLFGILMEQDYQIPEEKKRVALLYGSGEFLDAMSMADKLRNDYQVALFEKPKKVGKYLDKLKEQGYAYFYIMNQSEKLNALD
ncbi:MAG: histidine--tRNA ligase [Clostridiales bacterium]|nr:histidine--tRNA ligase [Clostridiales bacterium]